MRGALVTIVVPAFNRASTIEAALRSVQAQTYPNWEAIVVDDGSRDETIRTVERFAHEDARIRLIRHAENRGAQAARNTGIRHAQGQWVAFLDSDDRWVPLSLQLRLEEATKHHVSVVHSEAYQTREDGSTALHGVPAVEGWIYRELLCCPGPMFQCLLVTRRALQTIGGLDEQIVAHQEWDTAIRLAKQYRFAFVRSPTFVWDRRSEETITKDKRRDARGYEQVVLKHAEAIFKYAGPRVLSRHYAILAARYQRAGERTEAFRCLRRSRHFDQRQP